MPIELQIEGSRLLTLTMLSPLLGVLLVGLVPATQPGRARGAAILSASITFLLSFNVLSRFVTHGRGFQFAERVEWLPALGIDYILGIDGISLWLIVLTTLLTLLVVIASTSIHEKLRAYLASMLFLEVGMLGAFMALDALTFYVFWELMLVPMYFLIGIWGGSRRIYAALKFFLYTAFGSLLMLVAIVYLAFAHQDQFGEVSFFLGDWVNLQLSVREELLLFSAFALAFAIKVPVFPFHTWLPDAHVEAPTGGSVILAGVLLKMGLYGLIRFGIPVFPFATHAAAPTFAVLGVIGIVFGALVAWMQTDIKKLVAYSSVSHLGFCVLGYAAINIQGMQGSILQMLNHGVSTAALFFLVGVVYDRKHTRLCADYGGLARKTPVFAFVFLVFTLSSVGLPLTNGFVGEFLILLGSFQFSPVLAAVAVTGVIFGAMYMLSLYRRIMFGPFDEAKNGDLTDLTMRERLVFAPLFALVFVIGLYPQFILDDIAPPSRRLLEHLRGKEPAQAPAALEDGVQSARSVTAPADTDTVDYAIRVRTEEGVQG
ncbi:MAG: NADH-quinone oxidoreductase subunit M [Bdellovibrionales bacterium]|nr:NADH-quinone oxidoreductase subunit M [Bdellovibrionales bacterium]